MTDRSLALPDRIEDEAHLEELLGTPTPELVHDLAELEGDILILGIAGKVGPTLAQMAKRAAPHKRVVGVARFNEPGLAERIESWGIETIKCDLLDEQAVARLPKLPNVVYMAGKKFGTNDDPSFAWAMNTTVPATVTTRWLPTHHHRLVAVASIDSAYPAVSSERLRSTEDNGNPITSIAIIRSAVDR